MKTISKTEHGTWIVELEKEDLKYCDITRLCYSDKINVSFKSYEYDRARSRLEEAFERTKKAMESYRETLSLISEAGTMLGILLENKKMPKNKD